MSLLLGDLVPDFEQDSTEGPLRFHEHIDGYWAILFSHPRDFTPVCTTELGQVSKLKPEFEQRGVKVVGLSCDSLEDHARWIADIESTQGVALNFPLLADADRKVAELYEMLHPAAEDTFTVRSVFVIDPQKRLRLTLTYPAPTGRNFHEILRVVDSLQLTDRHKVATPVDWQRGDDVVILPSVSNEEAKAKFPDGWDEQRPYLRVVKQPD